MLIAHEGTLEMNSVTGDRPTCALVTPWDLQALGGVSQVVLNLYRETFLAGEMQPLIIVNQWSALCPVESVIEGRRTVHVRLSSPWSKQQSIMWFTKWIIASPVLLVNLFLLCHRNRIQVFNFQFPSLSVFPIALLRFLRLYRGDLILSFQGLDLRAAKGAGRIERALWRFIIHCATAVVGCSRAFAADVSEFVGRKSVHAIHNGLDIGYLISSMDQNTLLPTSLENRKFILTIATYEDKKGLDVLVRAFEKVRSENAGIALVLIGRSSHAESKLRSLVGELDLSDDIFFCANIPHSQIGVFLERATVFCLPSRAEPFGIAILEAGAYRLPVVASRVGGIPEIVIDGETGLLVEPDDANALAAALNRILEDTKLACEIGEKLYRRVDTDLTWRRAYEQYRLLLPNSTSSCA